MTMQKIPPAHRSPRTFFGWFAILSAVGLLPAIVAILNIPADPKRAFLFGFSLERLFMLGLSLAIAGVLLAAGIFILRNHPFFDRVEVTLFRTKRGIYRSIILLIGLVLILWVILWIPASWYGLLQPYIERIRPLLIWLTMTVVILIGLIRHLYITTDRSSRRISRSSLMSCVLTSTIFLLVVAGGYFLTDPANSTEVLYEAGVPILVEQIWLAVLGGLAVWFLSWLISNHLNDIPPGIAIVLEKRLDILLCIVLWLVSAFLWAGEPVRPSYFAPGPYPPDNVLFPYSDAASFDMTSQYAFDGQGLDGGKGVYRGLYPAFLVYLHTAAGQGHERLMALQAAMYAFFPVIIYLLVRLLASRPLAFSAALMITFRGVNAIASASWINADNPKHMMTDFPTAIWMALCCLFVMLALSKPAQRYFYIILAGGAVSLASLLRTNALMILPFIILILILDNWRKFGRALLMITLLVGGSLLAVYPWGLRNQNAGLDSIQTMYLSKITTVISSRYPKVIRPAETPSPAVSERTPTSLQDPLERESDDPFFVGLDQGFFTDLVERDPQLNRALNVASFVAELTYHNIATSLLILPTGNYFHDLYPMIKLEYPYWDANWDWKIPLSAVPNLLINLALLSIGITLALQKKYTGLTPMVLFFGYQISNGFARTAGGRYIVPVDWVVVVYYAIGLFAILTWLSRWLFGKNQQEENPSAIQLAENPSRFTTILRQVILASLLAFGTGALIPASEWLHRSQQPDTNLSSLMDELEHRGVTGREFSRIQIKEFLDQENAFITKGTLLYPRYMRADQSIFKSRDSDTYRARPFPRLAFELLKFREVTGIVLETEAIPENIQSGSKVIVIGCKGEFQEDAYMIVFLDGDSRVVLGSRELERCQPLAE